MWNVITKVMQITTGTIGTISKLLGKYLNKAQHPGTAENSHTGHCRVLQKAMMLKYNTFMMRSKRKSPIYCNNRTALTLYNQEAWFLSGIKL